MARHSRESADSELRAELARCETLHEEYTEIAYFVNRKLNELERRSEDLARQLHISARQAHVAPLDYGTLFHIPDEEEDACEVTLR